MAAERLWQSKRQHEQAMDAAEMAQQLDAHIVELTESIRRMTWWLVVLTVGSVSVSITALVVAVLALATAA